jgi:hypothetical protein
MVDAGAASWAAQEYGLAELGDARRTARVVAMAARVAEHPAGKVTEAFPTSAEQQGAYGLLENKRVRVESLIDAAGVACALRCAGELLAIVPVDGSSAAMADPYGRKGFGRVGTYSAGARGLKVISAIAVTAAGTPLGLCAQSLWMRSAKRPHARGRHAREMRRVEDKETQHFLDVLRATAARFDKEAPKTRCWFQLDREGDAWPILQTLAALSPHWFTVRAAWSRRVRRARKMGDLRRSIAQQPVLGQIELDVPAGPGRAARCAQLSVRIGRVVLDLCDRRTKRHFPLEVNVVWAHEVRTTPRGEQPLDWLLLTNRPVETLADAQLVLEGYALRWRIEEVHKTWKSGACCVEDAQLHTQAAVAKWATLLFTVAVRAERLKHLARNEPDKPASVELSPHEIRALVLLKRKEKKRTETIPQTMPTIGQAVRWMADLGGYTGKSSGGPPGTITIGRGLERVVAGAEVLKALGEPGIEM